MRADIKSIHVRMHAHTQTHTACARCLYMYKHNHFKRLVRKTYGMHVALHGSEAMLGAGRYIAVRGGVVGARALPEVMATTMAITAWRCVCLRSRCARGFQPRDPSCLIPMFGAWCPPRGTSFASTPPRHTEAATDASTAHRCDAVGILPHFRKAIATRTPLVPISPQVICPEVSS